MKRIFRFLTIVAIALVGGLLACSRQKAEYIGPAYIAAPDGFNTSALTPNKTAVNFTPAGASVKFNATFSSSVSWKLTITGQTSGAVHVIEGISDNLSNLPWTGAMDGAQFFKAGEVAKATLSFFGTSLTASANITIDGAPDYSSCGYFAAGADLNVPWTVSPTTGWNGFNLAPDGSVQVKNVKQGVATGIETGDPNNALRHDRKGNLVVAPEGQGYYYIMGLGDQSGYVSGIQFGSYAASGMYQTLAAYDPSKVWVNVYLYGSGDLNAQVQLEFLESSDGVAPPDQSADDIFVAYVTLSHTGWKLFSFRYSDLTVSVNSNGKNGNKIHEPGKLWGYDAVLVKLTNPNSPIELFMDYPIITVDTPFKPCH